MELFYKLSILIVLFIQTFRFKSRTIFFAQEKEKTQEKYIRGGNEVFCYNYFFYFFSSYHVI